jgi:hypothetical protein
VMGGSKEVGSVKGFEALIGTIFQSQNTCMIFFEIRLDSSHLFIGSIGIPVNL